MHNCTPDSAHSECICMQIELKMEAGDYPPLNMNTKRNISVKTVLNNSSDSEII